jgi:hypothetical protein
MISHLRYANYVARHKWFVFRAGLRTGAPIWRLLIHDWSKLTRAEWGPYVEQFYGDDNVLQASSFSRFMVQQAFDAAWLHHQHRNPHHWQHWCLREDGGDLKVLQMPEPFVREMVADWMGAGRAITGRWEVAEWYAKNRQTIQLHQATRAQVEALIEDVSNG